MNMRLIALPLLLIAGLAQAEDSDVQPYRYGSQPDIARVLRIDKPASPRCEVVTAVMTYRDSTDDLRRLSYLTTSEACTRQN
ncbi:DUF2790 domain-containing protein [Pseudomonas sp. A-1]|jgi:hypothetical protein|uniref:DUF2790 domain-containing protein n=1 Tax=Pseudomonas sp. A-1 TaxID=1821274 RepID=UPI0010A6638A|nr:DUF2790 domain-containing protein [Pseudomonas sp. A-1]THG83846.1 DUF2790 domain-containing protein [Pseudomonas sp. A-1]